MSDEQAQEFFTRKIADMVTRHCMVSQEGFDYAIFDVATGKSISGKAQFFIIMEEQIANDVVEFLNQHPKLREYTRRQFSDPDGPSRN